VSITYMLKATYGNLINLIPEGVYLFSIERETSLEKLNNMLTNERSEDILDRVRKRIKHIETQQEVKDLLA